MLQAFKCMVRRGEIRVEQGGLGETYEGRIDFTMAKDPLEADGEQKEENGSPKVEILQLTPARRIFWNKSITC